MTGRKLCRLLQIPLITICCVALCSTLYLVKFHRKIGWKHKHLCLSSHEIIRSGEVYRIFTHTFFHKGPWHLAITMVPMLILGAIIERHIGSIVFMLVINIIWVISVILEVAMATMLYHIFHNLFHGCSLGFSGIVFGLVVILPIAVKRKECGIGVLKISLSLLPWIFICLYYFAFHRGSVFLHLGGILAGYVYKYDILNCVLPSPERLAEWEDSEQCHFLVNLPCFIRFAKLTQSSHVQMADRRQDIFGHVLPQMSVSKPLLTEV